VVDDKLQQNITQRDSADHVAYLTTATTSRMLLQWTRHMFHQYNLLSPVRLSVRHKGWSVKNG